MRKKLQSTALLLILFCNFNLEAALIGDKTCATSDCHGSLKKFTHLHGPVKSDGCMVCHIKSKPTDVFKTNPKLPTQHPLFLLIKTSEVNETCLVCHEDKTGQGYKIIHKAIPEKTCISCHDPHSGNQKGILKIQPTADLCFSCHKDIKDKNQGGHASVLIENKSCFNCHESHFAKEEKLLKIKATSLCLSCHTKEISRANDRTVENIQNQMKTAVSTHKPLTDGKCQDCHDPHRPKLVNSPELCFECHKTELANVASTQEFTQFRNGSKNLHDLHLNKLKRNMNCQSCHEIHVSSQDALVKNQLDYKGFIFPMQYKKQTNGGTCLSACHGEKRYDRIKTFQNEAGR